MTTHEPEYLTYTTALTADTLETECCYTRLGDVLHILQKEEEERRHMKNIFEKFDIYTVRRLFPTDDDGWDSNN